MEQNVWGAGHLSGEQQRFFEDEGYLVVSGLLTAAELNEIRDTFMAIHAGGPVADVYKPVPLSEADGNLLKVYPRMINPHRFNDKIRQYMIHPGIMAVLADLFREEPLASQSMFYFKPPGALGQALHQDNYYLRVEPGTCIAAWVAVDRSDEENGGLVVVPKTNHLDIQCPHEADPRYSFTNDEVDIPEGLFAVPVNLEPGDVLFFNGNMIHGSYPNKSDRFRRSFICHYCGASATKVMEEELYTRTGEVINKGINLSSPCGTEFDAFTDKQYY